MSDRDRLQPNTSKLFQYEGGFDHNSPRPPIPGEERTHFQSDWGNPQYPPHFFESFKPSSCGRRKSALDGAEPDGCTRSSSSSSRHDPSPPPPVCLRWAQSLHHLLQDPDGVKLFQDYLESEGQPHADALDFWFACEGLRKQQSPDKIQQLVKVIYKKFFVKSALPISDELRRDVGKNIKNAQCLHPPVTLFDEAQSHVEGLINKTTYPNFLKSDMYLQYLESVQNPSSSGSSSDYCDPSSFVGHEPLPTVHEDMELQVHPIKMLGGSAPQARLTKDLLLMSQKHRAVDVRPKSETYASFFTNRGVIGGGVSHAYNSYNPVSRQDSEMQSLSSHSDARTESDNLSLTDSSIDGRSLGRSHRRQAAFEARQARESAALNRETHMNHNVIPRTQRLDPKQCQPMDRDQFAAILIEKLEVVRRDVEAQEKLDRKLKESESMGSMSDIQSRELANAIREKLQLEDDNDQDILDQHVSRVFADQTPARSPPPGVASPRGHRPLRLRRTNKDKDGFSTFSTDSGNVHDYPDMVKSKSMPEYPDERFVRNAPLRRSSLKKTMTDLTDSGVSVVSDTPPVGGLVKDNRVLAWLMESDKSGRGASHTHSEMSLKQRRSACGASASGPLLLHRKSSRSNSLERAPAQPFVADPSMPPLPSPNIAMQLEECRRRLLEDESRPRSRQQRSNRHYNELTQSSQSTLRKSTRGRVPVEEVTTVVFSFCDEQFPYRTKIPGGQITLRQFKEYLPKKGNYRFFFKTICEELGNQVIQEEVSNDGDVLPLWEGRIMAQVKPID